ncbi:hypothetical protein ACIQU4_07395 [Streptomyces sp. NPDC090741]
MTVRNLAPYDRCIECGDFHDIRTSTNGRYDFHQVDDLIKTTE